MKKLFYLLIFIFPAILLSQPVLSIRNLDSQTFPQMKAEIRATNNFQPITINQNNLLFLEGAFSHRDFTVGTPDAQGWQKIDWIPDHTAIEETQYSTNLVFTHEKETAFLP
ncbi:MAG: hypothetical protein RIF34_01170, partial [Candidatus Kapaibacterium sp.]